MAYQKAFIFDPHDLVMLWCHYTDGGVPLNSEVKSVGFNPFLTRFVGIEIESDEWQDSTPLHLRYEGRRVMSWKKNDSKENPVWKDSLETPERQ